MRLHAKCSKTSEYSKQSSGDCRDAEGADERVTNCIPHHGGVRSGRGFRGGEMQALLCHRATHCRRRAGSGEPRVEIVREQSHGRRTEDGDR